MWGFKVLTHYYSWPTSHGPNVVRVLVWSQVAYTSFLCLPRTGSQLSPQLGGRAQCQQIGSLRGRRRSCECVWRGGVNNVHISIIWSPSKLEVGVVWEELSSVPLIPILYWYWCWCWSVAYIRITSSPALCLGQVHETMIHRLFIHVLMTASSYQPP